MTKKAFREAMKRGLGRCIMELEHTENVEPYREIVLWGCIHDLAYDAQCEGSRAGYLYELIKRFPDKEPFLDAVIEKFSGNCSDGGWKFFQYCELLGCFSRDGEEKASAALWKKYEELYQILKRKRKRRKNGTCPELDDFERLCMELIDGADYPLEVYGKIAGDIGNLFQEGDIFQAFHFDWLFEHCQNNYGKARVQKALTSYARQSPKVAEYLTAMEAWKKKCAEKGEKGPRFPQTTEEFLTVFEEGKKPVPWISLGLKRAGNMEAVRIFAEQYATEQDVIRRTRLLRLFMGRCHFPLSPEQVLADAMSTDKELQDTALWALEFIRHEKVRQFALKLADREEYAPEAVSILACNYQPEDKETFVRLVRKLPVTHEDTGWHHAFGSVFKLLESREVKRVPTELLPFLYERTLCSCCRERALREMAAGIC